MEEDKVLLLKSFDEILKEADAICAIGDSIIEEYQQLNESSQQYAEEFDEISGTACKIESDLDGSVSDLGGKYTDISKQCKEVENILIETRNIHEMEAAKLDDLTKKLNSLKMEYDRLTNLCKDIKGEGELSEKDKQLMHDCKLKLDLYKQITGIKFDYTVAHTEAGRGYIRNRQTGSYQPFCYVNREENLTEACEALWSELGLTAQDWFHPDYDKENTAHKKN